MSILIQSKTLSVTAGLRSFIERQTRKLFTKSHRIQGVTVFLETIGRRKKNDQSATIARIKLSLPGKDVVVQRRAADLYQAIVEASHSAARQITRVKDKRITKRFRRLEKEQLQQLSLS